MQLDGGGPRALGVEGDVGRERGHFRVERVDVLAVHAHEAAFGRERGQHVVEGGWFGFGGELGKLAYHGMEVGDEVRVLVDRGVKEMLAVAGEEAG